MEFVDETFVPSEKDAKKARAFSRALARRIFPDSQLVLQRDGNVEAVEIPPAVVTVLTKVLSVMSEGKPFKLMPMDEELKNQHAADILNVSKSYLNEVLDSGDICNRKVGQNRLIKLIDLLGYKKRQGRSISTIACPALISPSFRTRRYQPVNRVSCTLTSSQPRTSRDNSCRIATERVAIWKS